MREFSEFVQVPELQALSPAALDGFKRFALRVHRAGLDWYFADYTFCWGRRELLAQAAKVRLGRILIVEGEPKLTVSVRTNGKQLLESRHGSHLAKTGSFDAEKGRYIVPLEQAPRLVEGVAGEEFLETALHLVGDNIRGGWFPPSYALPQSDREQLSEYPPPVAQPPAVVGMPPGLSLRCTAWRRQGHDAFRRAVVAHWSGQCAVHGQVHSAVLIASHIVPWCEADEAERTDPNNGLLLSAGIDALFDAGLISFDDSGRLLHRFQAEDHTLLALGIQPGSRIVLAHLLSAGTKRYLARHRQRHHF